MSASASTRSGWKYFEEKPTLLNLTIIKKAKSHSPKQNLPIFSDSSGVETSHNVRFEPHQKFQFVMNCSRLDIAIYTLRFHMNWAKRATVT